MESTHRYTAKANWAAGRRGWAHMDGVRSIEFSAPPEFQGDAGYWTPEHLFLASIVSCYVATFRAIAEHSGFDFHNLEVEAEGALARFEGGLQFNNILLRPVLTLTSESQRERAVLLLGKAERACIISRSVRPAVVLVPTVKVSKPQLALQGAERSSLPA